MNQRFLQRLPVRAVRETIAGLAFFALTITGLLGFSSNAAHAQTYVTKTLYSFGNDASHDGENPFAAFLNVNGLLYSTTENGGTFANGTLFQFDPSTNKEKPLYSFGTATSDGTNPFTPLINMNGSLFGTAGFGGGSGNDSGTLFSYNISTAKESTVYAFKGINGDGDFPRTGLLALNGHFFGTTSKGGTSGVGTIFEVDPTNGSETVFYSFTGANGDGDIPKGTLLDATVAGVEALYGTTLQGGINNQGTIFMINPDGTGYQNLHRFGDTTGDGLNPTGGLVNLNGIFYGVTELGGSHGNGAIYAYDPSTNRVTVVYNFGDNPNDGAQPADDLLVVNGLLFGTTANTTGLPIGGTVFSFDPSTLKESILHNFQGGTSEGNDLEAGLISVGGILYGTTNGGGANNTGTIFSLTPLLAPTAVNDTFPAKYKTTLTISAPGVLANDNAGNDPPITAALVTGPTHGSLTLNINGSFTYTPTGEFVGTDTFKYKDTNAVGTGNTATVTITVAAVAPIAVNNSNNVTENTPFTVAAPGVLGNDDNGGKAPITASLVSTVSHGTLTLSTNGAFTYTPTDGFTGTDVFSYQAVNSVGKSNTATATFTVKAGVPTAVNNSNTVKADTPFTVAAPGVLGNDFDGGSTMTASLVTTTGHGTLTLSSNGAFTYTPSHGFIGTDHFTYQAVNSVGKSNVATATLTVQASVPTAVNNSNSVKADTPLTVPAPGVLGNDFDGGSPMTALLVTTVAHGTLTLSSNGAFTYTPNHGFTGTDSFTYQAVNATGKSNIATVTFTVKAGVPTAVNNSNSVKKNTTFTVAAPGVLGNDFDGGSPMTALLVSSTPHGKLTLSSNGAFTYTPNTNFTGTDSFTYQAVNSVGKSNIATATLIVQ